MITRLSSAALLSLAVLVAAACGEYPTTPTATVPGPSFAPPAGKGGGGGGGGGGKTTTIPLSVAWSTDAAYAIQGDGGTYIDGTQGVNAYTLSGTGQWGYFDPQPTNYDGTAGRRWLFIAEQQSDAEVHVFNMTSVTSLGQPTATRVGIGIQTGAVRTATGCDQLIYDDAAYSAPDGGVDENGTVTLTDNANGKRTWQVTGDWAWCQVTSAHGGKLSTTGAVYYPFSFTMTEN